MNKQINKPSFWASLKPPKLSTFDLVLLALLTALNIVLERIVGVVGIDSSYGISFVVIVFAAAHYGPVGAIIVSCLGDFLGAFFSGVPNPAFTLTAAVQGMIYGIALYEKRGSYSFKKALLAIIPAGIICSLFMNSFFLSFFYTGLDVFWQKLLYTRLPQVLISVPLQLIITQLFMKTVYPRIKLK